MKNFLIKSASLVYLNFILTGIFGYLNRILYARELSIEEYGMFYTAFAFVSFFTSFRDLGLSEALTYFVPRWKINEEYQKIKESLFFTILVQFGVASFFFILLLIFKENIINIFFSGKSEAIYYLLPLGIWFIVLGFSEPIIKVLESFQIFKWTSWSQTIAISIVFVFSSFSFTYFKSYFAYGWIISAVFLVLIYNYLISKKIDWKDSNYRLPNSSTRKELINYSLPLIIVTAGGVLTNNLNTLVLSFFSTIKNVSLLNIAIPLAMVPYLSIIPLLTLLAPIISDSKAKNDIIGIKKILSFIYDEFIAITLPLILLGVLFSNEIIFYVFGEKYIAASLSLKILLIAYFILTFCNLNMTYISYLEISTKLKAKISILMIIVHLCLIIPLTYFYNLLGLTIAILLSQSILFIISLKYLQIIIDEIIVKSKTIKIIIINILLFIPIFYYLHSRVHNYNLITNLLICIIIYSSIIVTGLIFNIIDIRLFQNILSNKNTTKI